MDKTFWKITFAFHEEWIAHFIMIFFECEGKIYIVIQLELEKPRGRRGVKMAEK